MFSLVNLLSLWLSHIALLGISGLGLPLFFVSVFFLVGATALRVPFRVKTAQSSPCSPLQLSLLLTAGCLLAPRPVPGSRAPPATVPGSLLQQERLGKARDARALLSPHGRARQAPHNDLRRCGGRLELRATGAAKACPSRGQPRARTSNRSGPMHGGSGKQCRQRVPAVARRIALGARGRCCHTDATAGQRRHGAAAWQPRPRVPPRVTVCL